MKIKLSRCCLRRFDGERWSRGCCKHLQTTGNSQVISSDIADMSAPRFTLLFVLQPESHRTQMNRKMNNESLAADLENHQKKRRIYELPSKAQNQRHPRGTSTQYSDQHLHQADEVPGGILQVPPFSDCARYLSMPLEGLAPGGAGSGEERLERFGGRDGTGPGAFNPSAFGVQKWQNDSNGWWEVFVTAERPGG